jgi:hypothetical protein
MNGVSLVIRDTVTGEFWTPVYEQHSGEALAGIINGTLANMGPNMVIESIVVD